MHPGNIFIDITDPADPSYIAIDCAIIGTLSDEDQTYLARNILAFFNRDYGRIARLHIESGWIPPNTDPREFEEVIKRLLEPLFQRPLKEISFGHFLIALFQTARRFDMEVQPQLVLLQKTLLNIEGLGRQLYPDLDLWNTAKPFMETWMRERYGPVALFTSLIEHAPTLAVELPKLLPQLPDIVATAMHKLTDMDRRANAQREAMDRLTAAIDGQHRRARWRRTAGGVLVGLGIVLLWQPLVDALAGSDAMSVTAGVVAALTGSVLVLRG